MFSDAESAAGADLVPELLDAVDAPRLAVRSRDFFRATIAGRIGLFLHLLHTGGEPGTSGSSPYSLGS